MMADAINQGRQALDMGLGQSLEAFDNVIPSRPKGAASSEEQRRRVDQVSQFPSRDPDAKGDQINLKVSSEEKARFKAMAKKERYSHGEFLTILMNAYQDRGE